MPPLVQGYAVPVRMERAMQVGALGHGLESVPLALEAKGSDAFQG
jgi:hypothetical protein